MKVTAFALSASQYGHLHIVRLSVVYLSGVGHAGGTTLRRDMFFVILISGVLSAVSGV